jgi:hypothetical protein
MVGRYLGYKPETETTPQTPEDHAGNLIAQLAGLAGG